mmetsp:Transcript_8759/g.21594  ORF Transcript_8759/g.21594 Transcript_8759/m.21594 type:complete len:171 (+) Transcript_8759:194-706(+)
MEFADNDAEAVARTKRARTENLVVASESKVGAKGFFEKMEPEFARYLFRFLHPVEDVILKCAVVSKAWRRLSECEPLWCSLCQIHFQLKTSCGSKGGVSNSSAGGPPLPPVAIGKDGSDLSEAKAALSCKEAWVAWYKLYSSLGLDPIRVWTSAKDKDTRLHHFTGTLSR